MTVTGGLLRQSLLSALSIDIHVHPISSMSLVSAQAVLEDRRQDACNHVLDHDLSLISHTNVPVVYMKNGER